MKYFKLSEFETSGYKVTDSNIQYNIECLVDNVLDKLRSYYGKPVYVNEGYNPKSTLTGHTIGISADITTKSKLGNIDIFEYAKTLQFNDLSVIGDFDAIHVSYYPLNKNLIIDNTQSSDKMLSDYVVCIDSGHGRDVAGKRSPDSSLLEWEWTREIKYKLINQLETLKIAKCFDVNPETTEPGLTTRANRVNDVYKKNNKKAIYISIHVNAAGSGQWMNARGWSIYTSVGQTKADTLATIIYNEAEKVFLPKNLSLRKDMSDGDVDKEANFTVLVKSSCPAVLVENFFMDNKDDVKYLLSSEGKSDIVNVLFNGIKKYLQTAV